MQFVVPAFEVCALSSPRRRELELFEQRHRFGGDRSSSDAGDQAGFVLSAWAQDPGGRPGAVRRGSKFRPNFCNVLTTKLRMPPGRP